MCVLQIKSFITRTAYRQIGHVQRTVHIIIQPRYAKARRFGAQRGAREVL